MASGGGSRPQVKYRAAFGVGGYKTRQWGAPSKSIASAVADLLPKLNITSDDKQAVWAETTQLQEQIQPASSPKKRNERCPPCVVFFKKHPCEGNVQSRVREAGGKLRMVLRRKGNLNLHSNWHSTYVHSRRHSGVSYIGASAWAKMYRL